MDVGMPFSVERSAVFKTLLLTPSSGWPLWTAALTGVVLAVWGCLADIRLTVLGLMVCLAVIPCIAAFIYLFHTLAPEMVANLLPHTLERNPDGFLLRTWRRRDPEAEPEEDGEWVESGRLELADADIVDRKTSYGYDILFFKDSRMKILYVPRF